MVGREAVLQAVRTARVLRDVAADRADDLAGRVGSEVQVVRGRPRRRCRALVTPGWTTARWFCDVDGQDRAHPGQPDDDPVGDGQRTAGQARPRTAGDERDPFAGADPHDRRDLLRGRRQHHQRRNHAVTGQPVAFIGAKLRRFGDDAACADQPADLSADLPGDPPGGLLGHQVEIRRHGHRPPQSSSRYTGSVQPSRGPSATCLKTSRASLNRPASLTSAPPPAHPRQFLGLVQTLLPLPRAHTIRPRIQRRHRERGACHHFHAATNSLQSPPSHHQAIVVRNSRKIEGAIANPASRSGPQSRSTDVDW